MAVESRGRRHGLRAAALVLLALAVGPGCRVELSMERLIQARRLAANLGAAMAQAADASNRAVMATRDEDAAAAAREADALAESMRLDIGALATQLAALRYGEESRLLADLQTRVAAYRALDQSVLQLAVEGSNVKAQRLSFGAGRAAADEVGASLADIGRGADASSRWRIDAAAATAMMRVREIQSLQAPHIAEAGDDVMTRLERDMTTATSAARSALETLGPLVSASSRPRLTAAAAALDRFLAVNAEVVALSRRNTNVRSLELSLNRMRVLRAACAESVRMLSDALARRGTTATR